MELFLIYRLANEKYSSIIVKRYKSHGPKSEFKAVI